MKIGRNDPCPCGSGLKYKVCCLAKDAKVESEAIEIARRRAENLFVGRTGAFTHAIDRVRAYDPPKPD
jgi:hypothetical protein